MPIFGGVTTISVRDQMHWTPADHKVFGELSNEDPLDLDELCWKLAMPKPVVLDSIGRMRRSGLVKQLRHGKWILQQGAAADAGKGVRGEYNKGSASRSRKRAA